MDVVVVEEARVVSDAVAVEVVVESDVVLFKIVPDTEYGMQPEDGSTTTFPIAITAFGTVSSKTVRLQDAKILMRGCPPAKVIPCRVRT